MQVDSWIPILFKEIWSINQFPSLFFSPLLSLPSIFPSFLTFLFLSFFLPSLSFPPLTKPFSFLLPSFLPLLYLCFDNQNILLMAQLFILHSNCPDWISTSLLQAGSYVILIWHQYFWALFCFLIQQNISVSCCAFVLFLTQLWNQPFIQ